MVTLYDNNGNSVKVQHAVDVKTALKTGRYSLVAPWETRAKELAEQEKQLKSEKVVKPEPISRIAEVVEETKPESSDAGRRSYTKKPLETKDVLDDEPKKKKFSFVDEDKDANK